MYELQAPVRKSKGGGGSGAKLGCAGRQESGEAEKEKAGAKREEFLIKAAPAQAAKGKARS